MFRSIKTGKECEMKKVNIQGIDDLTSVIKLLKSAGYICEIKNDELILVEDLAIKYKLVEVFFNDKRLSDIDGIMKLFYLPFLLDEIDFNDDFTCEVIRKAYNILAGGEG